MKKSELKDEIKRYHEECERKDEEIKKLFEQNSKLVQDEFKTSVRLSTEINNLKSENEKLKIRYSKEDGYHTAEVNQMQSTIDEQRVKIVELKQRILNQSESISLLREENEELKKKDLLKLECTEMLNALRDGKEYLEDRDKEIEKLKDENERLKDNMFHSLFINSLKNGSRFVDGLNKGLRIGYGLEAIDKDDDWYYFVATFQKNWAKNPETKSFWRIFK